MAKTTTKSKRSSNAKRVVKPLVVTRPAAKRSAPAVKATAPKPVGGDFTPGARVMHPMFGPGVVLSVAGDVLEIKFKAVGVKRIVDSFVNRA